MNKCHIERTLKTVRGRRRFIEEVCTHNVNINSEKDPSEAHILQNLLGHITLLDACYLFLKMQTDPEGPDQMCNLRRKGVSIVGTQNITSVGPE